MLPGEINRETMDLPREDTQHQLLRTPGSLSSIEIISDPKQNTFSVAEIGQRICSSFRQQDGRDPLAVDVRSGSGDVEVVPVEGCSDSCRTHPAGVENVRADWESSPHQQTQPYTL